ncbi:hypothetical protein DFJ43DRAFT_1106111 [Lentinula guzmanii]|uniref:Uncharacterized protein n=1 Tax=Lentinula guzmanii TaxID=2804957 RepID=A0AA38MUL6_9AGAR|nr:hypothetical protein DFJ43DRAFT_1106111 [Lentinula guzmanii]
MLFLRKHAEEPALTEKRFQGFVSDPGNRQLIDQWSSLAYWEGPKLTFARVLYNLWQTDPNRLHFRDNLFSEQQLDTAMALREMALVWDIEPDLQEESEDVKEKPKKEFIQAGGFDSSSMLKSGPLEPFPSVQSLASPWPPTCRLMSLPGPNEASPKYAPQAQEITFTSKKSPFAYLEWHKLIDEGIINGKVASNLRSLSVHLAGATITGGESDIAAGQKSMNSIIVPRAHGIVSESESLTQSPNLIQVVPDAEEVSFVSLFLKYHSLSCQTDILLLTPSNKVNVCRDSVQHPNNETSDVPTAEEAQVAFLEENVRIYHAPVEAHSEEIENISSPSTHTLVGHKSAGLGKEARLSNVTHRSVKREFRQLVRVAGPTAASQDSTKPLTIRIPPVTAQDPANFHHNGRPSSPLTPVLQQTSPRPPLNSKKTVSLAPLSIHRRSARIAANNERTFSSK